MTDTLMLEPIEFSMDEIKQQVIDAVKLVYDPEIPVNIYDLGLIYSIDIRADYHVKIQMTLTSPNCPEAQSLPGMVELAVKDVPGVVDASVEIVWEPPWSKELMSEEAKYLLNLF